MPNKYIVAVLLVAAVACSRSRPREYDLRGQVLAIDPNRQEITITHGDIAGFMPAMTMAFKVKDRRLLEEHAPGDLVKARLVVEGQDAFLSAIERTGHAALSDASPAHPAMNVLNRGDVIPDAVLVDQNGKPRRLSEWRGQVLAVTFIYTRCPLPNFCPLMDRNFGAVQKAIASDRTLRGRVHLLTVSFDPEFDTPAVLAAHAASLGADSSIWTIATGDRATVDLLTERFGVSVFHEGQTATDVVHNLRTAVVDGNGRVVEVLNGNDWKPEDLLALLRTAAGGR
jgi:protein SCO1/2